MAAKRKKPMYLPPPMPSRAGWRDEGSGATYYGKNVRFSVHQHIDEPGAWFVSCYSLSQHRIVLKGATTLVEAKTIAPEALKMLIETHISDIEEAIRTIK